MLKPKVYFFFCILCTEMIRFNINTQINVLKNIQSLKKQKQFQARIFSYLIVEDAEMFPGTLACDHNGSMLKLLTGENLITQMYNYFEFLSNITVTKPLWTDPYLDSWGLGLMITLAVPVTNKDGRLAEFIFDTF